MENTALKLSAQEIIKEFSKDTGNLDLLKIFLITNSADIAREYEFMTKLLKNGSISEAEKATYEKACRTLINISLRRIALSDAIYSANDNAPVITQPETTTAIEEEKPTIMMLPSLEDLLTRVRKALSEDTDIEISKKEAFESLKTTVGQGKVLNAEGKPETWDNERINAFISESVPKTEVKEGEKYGFDTIYQIASDMASNGKTEPEIREHLKSILIGKIIKSTDAAGDYLVKDEKVFDDVYSRMLLNVININVKAYTDKQNADSTKSPLADAEQKIIEEVKPILEALDKNETESSFAKIAAKIKGIYASFHIKKTYADALDKAKEIGETTAPNLMKRNKIASQNDIPIIKTEPKADTPAVEIYDESHNIKETNKELWAEVEKYEYLNQLFTKAIELSKAGNWRDALNMSIILISSGKIKETETSTETLKWDADQTKLWYHANVEVAVSRADETPVVETIDAVAEVIEDKKPESIQQGPVPQAGSIDAKEGISRLLKDNTPWKDTYKFKSFHVNTDHHRGGAMSLEIVDATNDQEKDLLITESNLTKYFDSQRDSLVEARNNFPKVKADIYARLSPFYEISHSEVNRITGALAKEADELRKEVKKTAKLEKVMEVADDVVQTIPEVTKVEETNNPPVERPANVEETKSPEVSTVVETQAISTEKPAGESPTNSNNETNPYIGFETIVKAKTKFDFQKAIYSKILEYPKSEDGVKAVFEVVNTARKDHHYKKAFMRQYKPANEVDLLSAINNILVAGEKASKSQ